MNPYLAVAVLVCTVALLFMLPLLPALVELRRKSDALPLSVVQQNAGEIRHFANSFRDYIKGLEPIMQDCMAAGTSATGTLPDGEEYVVLGRLDEPLVRALAQRDATHPVLIAAGADLVVPPHATFSRDIYAGAKFQGGEKNNYRAILGEKECSPGRFEPGDALGSCRRRVHGGLGLQPLRAHFLGLADTPAGQLQLPAAERSPH